MRHSWLVLALACAVTGGCGQTGSLYLPDKEGEVVSSTTDAAVDGDAGETTTDAERKRADEQRQPAPQ